MSRFSCSHCGKSWLAAFSPYSWTAQTIHGLHCQRRWYWWMMPLGLKITWAWKRMGVAHG